MIRATRASLILRGLGLVLWGLALATALVYAVLGILSAL